jgi:hypothetical protein
MSEGYDGYEDLIKTTKIDQSDEIITLFNLSKPLF